MLFIRKLQMFICADTKLSSEIKTTKKELLPVSQICLQYFHFRGNLKLLEKINGL